MRSIELHEQIEKKIYFFRETKVMLDRDLAELYDVETRVLIQAVKRNIERFPEEFMFRLTKDEMKSLRSQNVILKRGQHYKYLPYVFTEQGVAMLSSVLKSKKAIQINIAIMKIFIQLREASYSHKELLVKINLLEKRFNKHDEDIKSIFAAIKHLITEDARPKRPLGFRIN